MKKVFSFFTITIFCFSFSFSQTTVTVSAGASVHCQVGLKDATEQSWNDYFIYVSSPNRVKSIKNDKFNIGFNAGVNVDIPLKKNFVFRPGVQFNIKGGKAEGTYGTGSTSYPFSSETIFRYVDIPLLMQYWITKRIYVELGLQPAFLLSAKYKENDNGTKTEDSNKSDYKKVDLAIAGGAGYSFGNGFGFFARIVEGITKVDISETYYSKVRNSVGQYGFYYKINTKK